MKRWVMMWPAFLTACMLELVVFAMVDPADVQWMGQPVALSATAIYSLAFFVFWIICAVGGALGASLSDSANSSHHQ